MLLPFRGLPYIDDNEEETTITPEPSSAEEETTATSSESSTDSEAEDLRARNEPTQRYVIPKEEVKVRETQETETDLEKTGTMQIHGDHLPEEETESDNLRLGYGQMTGR